MSKNEVTYFLMRGPDGEASCLLSPIRHKLFSRIVFPKYLLQGFAVERITEAQWETYQEIGSLGVVPYDEIMAITKIGS